MGRHPDANMPAQITKQVMKGYVATVAEKKYKSMVHLTMMIMTSDDDERPETFPPATHGAYAPCL